MAELIERPDPICERCNMNLKYTGSHYHCGACDSNDVTSMMGHHTSIHIVNGKITDVGFHHCTKNRGGTVCELDNTFQK